MQLEVVGKNLVIGFIYGLNQSSLVVRMRIKPNGNLGKFQYSLAGNAIDEPMLVIDGMGAENKSDKARSLIKYCELFVRWLLGVQYLAGWPIIHRFVVESVRAENRFGTAAIVELVIPTFYPRILIEYLSVAVDVFVSAGRSTSWNVEIESSLIELLRKSEFHDDNTQFLVHRGCAHGVPVRVLSDRVVQYGWGSSARKMDDVLTDRDSAIGLKLIQCANTSSALFRRAGIPLPEQCVAREVESAISFAGEIGYPVVLRPVALDGAKGIAAVIQDERSLRVAFDHPSASGQTLIVQRHISGRTHRVIILFGKVAQANCLEPAGVWGDGKSSVSALVDLENAGIGRLIQADCPFVPLEC